MGSVNAVRHRYGLPPCPQSHWKWLWYCTPCKRRLLRCFGFGGRLNDITCRHRKRSGSVHVLPAFTLKLTQPFCSQAVFFCVIPVVVTANSCYLPVRRYAVVCDGHWVLGGGCCSVGQDFWLFVPYRTELHFIALWLYSLYTKARTHTIKLKLHWWQRTHPPSSARG
jgi:hypothetical protein